VDDSYDTEVSAALLGFGMLDTMQRRAFAEQFNKFVYGSPHGQRRMIEVWSTQCRESENPTARMIAETSAVYVASRQKRRKVNRRK
jgi:hypothetical protein